MSGASLGHLENIANSTRKRELVLMVARGRTVGEMAEELGISQRTVKTHLDQMRMAFGGVLRRDIPRAWYTLTGENPYPDDGELELMNNGKR